jgi:hypothetical protein
MKIFLNWPLWHLPAWRYITALIAADKNIMQLLKTVHSFTRSAIQFHYF